MAREAAVQIIRGLLAALLALAAAGAAAQAQQPTPGTIRDTVPERRPAAPSGPPQFVFPRDEEPRAAEREGRRFPVYGFEFVGNTVFTRGELRRVVERFVDLELNLFELNRAADAVTRFYRDRGYPIARAIIPAQRVRDGLVRIEVVEGRIGKIAFDGNKRYDAEFLGLRTKPLEGDLVTLAGLERSLLLLNDLPGLTARATLEPGKEFGTTDASIRIEEKPAEATLQLNNSGRKEVGLWRLDAQASLNNPLGFGDQLGARFIRSQHDLLDYRRFSYSVPLWPNGLRLSLARSEIDYQVGGDFAALGIRGEVRGDELTLAYPVQRSRIRNVLLSGGWRRTRSTQQALGVPVSERKIELLTGALNTSWVHADSSASTLTFALSGNGRPNRDSSAPKQDALRAKLELDYTYLTGISPNWDMFFRGNLVRASGVAPDTEKYSLGGPDSVRAYRGAELRGDNGWLLVAEFRHQFTLGPTVGVVTVFYDKGGVSSKGFQGQDKLAGLGVGVTLFAGRHARAQVEWARPTTDRDPADGKKSGRLWFTFAATF